MENAKDLKDVFEAMTYFLVFLLTCAVTIFWLKRKARKKK